MKFTNGAWLLQKDVKLLHPIQVDLLDVTPAALTVSAATRRVSGRQDMHDTAMLTLQFSSPLADVLRVKVFHFKSSKPRLPQFKINVSPDLPVQVSDDPQSACLTSGALSVRVSKSAPWAVEFCAAGHVLTASRASTPRAARWSCTP